jgi:hypothetical protein
MTGRLASLAATVCGCLGSSCYIRDLDFGCAGGFLNYTNTPTSFGAFQVMGAALDFLPSDLTFSFPSSGDCTQSLVFLVNGTTVLETHNMTQLSSNECSVEFAFAPLYAYAPRAPGDFAAVVALKNVGASQNVSITATPPVGHLAFSNTNTHSSGPPPVDVHITLGTPLLPCCDKPASLVTNVGVFQVSDSVSACGEYVTATYSLLGYYPPSASGVSNGTHIFYNVSVDSTSSACGQNALFDPFWFQVVAPVPPPPPPRRLGAAETAAISIGSILAFGIFIVSVIFWCLDTAPTSVERRAPKRPTPVPDRQLQLPLPPQRLQPSRRRRPPPFIPQASGL